MLRIPCPNCGLRDEPEFVFGGPSHITRPDYAVDDKTWTQYLYDRDNSVGLNFERWLHAYGCGLWFNVARNTLTHALVAVYGMGEPKPDLHL
jgi:sarcosine oxidase subunit delta